MASSSSEFPELKRFEEGASKTGLEKLNNIVESVQRLVHSEKRRRTEAPYKFVCVKDGELALFEIAAQLVEFPYEGGSTVANEGPQ